MASSAVTSARAHSDHSASGHPGTRARSNSPTAPPIAKHLASASSLLMGSALAATESKPDRRLLRHADKAIAFCTDSSAAASCNSAQSSASRLPKSDARQLRTPDAEPATRRSRDTATATGSDSGSSHRGYGSTGATVTCTDGFPPPRAPRSLTSLSAPTTSMKSSSSSIAFLRAAAVSGAPVPLPLPVFFPDAAGVGFWPVPFFLFVAGVAACTADLLLVSASAFPVAGTLRFAGPFLEFDLCCSAFSPPADAHSEPSLESSTATTGADFFATFFFAARLFCQGVSSSPPLFTEATSDCTATLRFLAVAFAFTAIVLLLPPFNNASEGVTDSDCPSLSLTSLALFLSRADAPFACSFFLSNAASSCESNCESPLSPPDPPSSLSRRRNFFFGRSSAASLAELSSSRPRRFASCFAFCLSPMYSALI
eukprot:Opistho-2@62236